MTTTDDIEGSGFAALAELFGLAGVEYAWRAEAACRDRPDLNWFPGRGEDISKQRAVCAGCPVRAECLASAQRHGERFGIWGGSSGRERRALVATGVPRRERGVYESILDVLAEGVWRSTTGALADEVGCSQAAVSQALRKLEADGRVVVDPPSPRATGAKIRSIRLAEALEVAS